MNLQSQVLRIQTSLLCLKRWLYDLRSHQIFGAPSFGETVTLASPSLLSIPLTLVSVPLCLSSLGTASYGILLILFLIQNQSHIFLFGAEKNLIRSIIQKQATTNDLLAAMLIAFVYGGCLVAVAIILVTFLSVFDNFALSTTNFSLAGRYTRAFIMDRPAFNSSGQ